jgi:hypothetical protein
LLLNKDPKLGIYIYKAEIEIAEIKFLSGVSGYTGKYQIRNTKIKEELIIFNLNAKILKSG